MDDRNTALVVIAALCAVLSVGSMSPPAAANPAPMATVTTPSVQAALSSLTIEELMNIEVEVTSASRKSQKLSETAAAVYVITADDIRRTGANSIPEALRLAPGMDVARVDANKWAVSCRGFNDIFANKMLVLIDGRTIYTSTFSGVWWDALGVAMSDVDRIEVVRGPGATLWGANAVNGVINIITKPAASTQGFTAAYLGGGADVESAMGLSYGDLLGANARYSFHTNYTSYNNLLSPAGGPANDSWDQTIARARVDWQPTSDSTVSCLLNRYSGKDRQQFITNLRSPAYMQLLSDEVSPSGTSFLTRWSRSMSEDSDMAVQLYYDHTKRIDDILFSEICNTYDLDFQHRFRLRRKHEIIWGLGYRFIDDEVGEGNVTWSQARRETHLISAFMQDEVPLSDRLRLTVGSKLEHSSFTGFEAQPNARLLWTPGEHQAVWAAVSRAVRTPARIEREVRFILEAVPNGTGGLDYFGLIGTPDYGSEHLTAYELGYRNQPAAGLSVDVAAFYNRYSRLLAFRALPPYADGTNNYAFVTAANSMSGQVYGAELSATWRVTPSWKLTCSYSATRTELSIPPSVGDTFSAPLFEGSTPRNQFCLTSFVDLPRSLTLDAVLRMVGKLPVRNVPAYTQLDARLGWKGPAGLDLSLMVVNLLNERHVEFGPFYGERISAIGRGASGSVAWRF